MKKLNLVNVKEAGNYDGITAGGYICKYTDVFDDDAKEYLYMEFDIAEGEFKDYFAGLEARAGFWGGRCYRSYKEKALPMFKRMCSAVTKSNPGFLFDGGEFNSDERTLIGKYVGIVLGEEEYEKNNGDVGTRTYVAAECPVEDIRKGNFRIPKKKVLNATTATPNPAQIPGVFMDIDTDEELPFN